MKLGIISDAHHYWDMRGKLCVLGPVARQFEQWAALFDEVVVCAPLLRGMPPSTHDAYRASNIRLLPISPAGGNTWTAKLQLAMHLVPWWRTIKSLLAQVDAVHIRCPNNISIPGLLALERSHVLRQALYTGTWNGYATEPATYRWQREYLRDKFTGPVAVYGAWPDQPAHVIPSFSPSYRDADWEAETEQVASRLDRLRRQTELRPVRLISVGQLDDNKNQQVAIRAVRLLADRGLDPHLVILGDGARRGMLEQLVDELGLRDRVHLNGPTAQAVVRQFYRNADFVVQPTRSEGFGKVPLEAFFHGVVPILSDITLHPQFTGDGERGRCFATEDPEDAARQIAELAARPAEVARMIENGRAYVKAFTLEAWQVHISNMLQTHWKRALREAP